MAIACATATFVLALSASAIAAPPKDKQSEAKEVYERGVRNFNVGKFAEAAQDFQAAYEISGRDDLLFNIAQTWRQAKNYEKALFFYKAYLAVFRRRDQWPPERALIEQRIEEANEAIAAARAAPKPTPTPTPEEPPAAAPTPPPVESPKIITTAPPRRAQAAPRWMRPLGLSIGVVGAGALIGGGVLGGLARSAAGDIEKAMGEFDGTLQHKQQLGLIYQSTAIGLIGAGGALLLAGTVPLSLSFRRPRAYAIAPVLAPDAAGLALAGQF